MATALKNSRLKPAAASLSALYTCPALTTSVVSSITVCNLSNTQTTFRVALSPLGAAIADSHYIYYDVTLAGNDTFIFTGGITLIATDEIRVYSASGDVSFNLFYQEIS